MSPDPSFRHQTRAVEMLGFKLFDPNSGVRVEARSISLEVPKDWLFRPAPAEFLQANQSDDLSLCLAHVRPAGPNSELHTFAVHRRCYYDNNTGGITSIANSKSMYCSIGIVNSCGGMRLINRTSPLAAAVDQSRAANAHTLRLVEKTLESVREHHAGLCGFRQQHESGWRRGAGRRGALWLGYSSPWPAGVRQRPSQAKLRSTIQRLGRTTKPLT